MSVRLLCEQDKQMPRCMAPLNAAKIAVAEGVVGCGDCIGIKFREDAGRIADLEAENAALYETIATLLQRNEELEKLATHDELTGYKNRRGLGETYSGEVQSENPGGIIFGDIVGFKLINERFGHVVGDTALQWISGIGNDALRGEDSVMARSGGDEFVAILKNISDDERKLWPSHKDTTSKPKTDTNADPAPEPENWVEVPMERVRDCLREDKVIKLYRYLFPENPLGFRLKGGPIDPNQSLTEALASYDPKGKSEQKPEYFVEVDPLLSPADAMYAILMQVAVAKGIEVPEL